MLHHENFSETEALKMCHILLMGSCYVGVGEVVLQPVFNDMQLLYWPWTQRLEQRTVCVTCLGILDHWWVRSECVSNVSVSFFMFIILERGGLRLTCKILLLLPRRSETPGRPHSWHSTKLSENQPDPSMMQISQGMLGTPWLQSYHSR